MRHYAAYDEARFLIIRDDLADLLYDEESNDSTPFNDGDYGEESYNGEHYKNPKRLAWIKAVVNSFGEEK